MLLDVAVYLNAAITALDLRRELQAASDFELPVYYGVCDLRTLLVTSVPVTPTTTEPDLHWLRRTQLALSSWAKSWWTCS